MDQSSKVCSATPFLFNLDQRVRCVTGERGRIFGRCLSTQGPRYGVELGVSRRAVMLYESELTAMMSSVDPGQPNAPAETSSSREAEVVPPLVEA